MKILAWILAVVATSALALASLALLFPGLKEGFSFEEVAFFLAGAVALAGVGVLWWHGTGRSLARALLAPASSALIGASADPAKTTSRPQRYRRKHGFMGPLYPVNPGRTEIFGEPAYASPEAGALKRAPQLTSRRHSRRGGSRRRPGGCRSPCPT